MPISASHHGELRNITYFGINPKETFRVINAISENDKKGRSQTGTDVWGVAKIQNANNSIELVGMDFAEYGDFATFVRIHDAFRVSR